MLGKLHRETLAEQASANLMAYIQEQKLQPGESLPSEAELINEFGVSRQVIREALKSLQGRGIIEIVNGRRATVKPITPEILQTFFSRATDLDRNSIIELIEVRKGIEIQSAVLAAERRTEAELQQLEEIVKEMATQIGNLDTYISLDLKLHEIIATATHNSMFYHLIQSIRQACIDTIREGLLHRRTRQELERVQEMHETLIACIRTQDGKAAGEAMTIHFDEAIVALVSPEVQA
jgi:DNA-binding FadR family transcriptional regulator